MHTNFTSLLERFLRGNQTIETEKVSFNSNSGINVGFLLRSWCQLFPLAGVLWIRRLFKSVFRSLSLRLSVGPINIRSQPLSSNYLHFSRHFPRLKQFHLLWWMTSGQTVVHVPTCPRGACACPRRLAAGTVDSPLGKLRSIFNKLGRLDHTNPITHPPIKEYLNFVASDKRVWLFRLRRLCHCSFLSSRI